MIRILHTADLLLDHPFAELGALAEVRRDDQVRTFEKLVNLAIKNEVDLLLCAGNLFATPRPDPRLVEAVREGLQRLVDRQIAPVVLPGGLDGVFTPDNIYRSVPIPGMLLGDIRRLRRPLTLEMKSTALHLYGFVWNGGDGDPAGLSAMKRQDLDGVHVGVLQARLEEDPKRYFRELPVVDPAAMRGLDLDYVALGNRRNWHEPGENDNAWGVFPGSPEGTSFRETGARSCALVTLGDGPPRIEKLAVNSRTLEERKVDVSGAEDNATIARAIARHAHPEIILKAVLKGEPAVLPDPGKLQARVGDQFAGLLVEERCVLLEGTFAEILNRRGKPFSSLLEEASGLHAQATSERESRLLEEGFRVALAHLEKTAGGES